MKKIVYTLLILCILINSNINAQNINLGLIACYPFSANANDQSGNGHNGTAFGPVLTSDRFNSPNAAYYFDGVDDYINLGPFSNFTNSNDFSISVWIQPSQVKLQTILMVNPDNFNDRFNAMANYDHNGVSATIWDFGDCTVGGRLIQVGTSFSNTWQYWTFTISQANGMKVYKNGVLETSQINHSQLIDRNRDLWIGGGSDANNAPFYFSGKIDDMRLYDRELTLNEIQTLYNLTWLCTPTSLTEMSVDKNNFDVFSDGNHMIVQVAPETPVSQFNLFTVEGKLIYMRENVKGGDTFEILLDNISSGFFTYSFILNSGVVSGKIISGK